MPSHTSRILALPNPPTEQELETVAVAIARDCAARRKPRVATATIWVHARRQKAPPATVSRLEGLVADRLNGEAAGLVRTEPTPVRGAFVHVEVAAAAYGLPAKTLALRLRFVRWRRLYGWAFWDGHRWQLPAAALDAMERASFLARQPVDEPEAHVRMLPPWCERTEGAGIAGAPNESSAGLP
jgi:hypothetical protein